MSNGFCNSSKISDNPRAAEITKGRSLPRMASAQEHKVDTLKGSHYETGENLKNIDKTDTEMMCRRKPYPIGRRIGPGEPKP